MIFIPGTAEWGYQNHPSVGRDSMPIEIGGLDESRDRRRRFGGASALEWSYNKRIWILGVHKIQPP